MKHAKTLLRRLAGGGRVENCALAGWGVFGLRASKAARGRRRRRARRGRGLQRREDGLVLVAQ
eukprot:4206771-Alexandrium_andersonii.AAC.1